MTVRSRLVIGVVAALMVTAVTPASAVKSLPPGVYGLAVAGAPGDLSQVDVVNGETGHHPTQITWYQAWSAGGTFPAAQAKAIAGRGAVPEMVWEPWNPSAGVDQPGYRLSQISAGAYDGYLTAWARAIKAYGGPLVIRFAHEMNGTWCPWAEGVNGNAPGSYRAAWQHVVSVFQHIHVNNVSWFWAPNVPFPGSPSLVSLYPGDAYVSRVGLDGYNWGTTQTWSTWQSFADLFGPGVATLTSMTAKPIYIGETASAESGGDKAMWISDMWAWLGQHSEVRGLTWFDLDKEVDWRVDSTAGSLAAFSAGLTGFSG